jgi:hypothetical protein
MSEDTTGGSNEVTMESLARANTSLQSDLTAAKAEVGRQNWLIEHMKEEHDATKRQLAEAVGALECYAAEDEWTDWHGDEHLGADVKWRGYGDQGYTLAKETQEGTGLGKEEAR